MTTEEEFQRVSEDYSALKIKYWEVTHSINNKGWQLQLEVERDRTRKANETIGKLLKEIEDYKERIKNVQPVIGAWVSQATHLKKCERVKELELEIRTLKNQ